MSHLRANRPPGYFGPGKRQTFIAKLRKCRNISAVCRAMDISRSTPDYWRNRDPGFAARMADALGDTADRTAVRLVSKEGGARPVEVKAGHNMTRPEDYDCFLEQLALTSNVKAACEQAGINSTTVYRHRRKDPGFARAWMAALAEGYEELEMTMLARARFGVERPVFHGGKRVGEVTEYSDAVALKLLSLHKQSVAHFRAMEQGVDEDVLLDEIDAKLAEMKARLEANGKTPADE